MVKACVILSLAFFAVAYSGFNLYLNGSVSFSSDEAATTWWMAWMAASKTAIAYSFYSYVKRTDKLLKSIVFYFLLLSLNELIDELLFDPCTFQLNEIVFIIAGAWHTTRIIYERR